MASSTGNFATAGGWVKLRTESYIQTRDEANNRSLVRSDLYIDVSGGGASSYNINVYLTTAGVNTSRGLGYQNYADGAHVVIVGQEVWVGHDANGYLGSVAFSASATSGGWGNASNGGSVTGFNDYDRRPGVPGFANITRTTDSIYVALSGVASPAGTPTYYIQRNTNGGGWGDQRTGSSATFSNLPQGSTHQFRAFATNSDGQSGSADSGVYSVPTVPGAPSITVSAPAARTRNVTAGTPSNGGAGITGYYAQASSDDGATWGAVRQMSGQTTSFTSLISGATYRFRVYATNEMGSSSVSTSGSTFIPTVPVAPSFSATTPSGRSLTVTAGVSENGGATVTGYFVQSSLDEGATWSGAQSLTSERTFNFTNLQGGSTYLFRVYSTNEVGSSALTTSAPIFVTSGGRRASGSGFVSATIAKRWTATGFVDIVTAKRWTGTIWTDLS
jgi:hypothetical protein